VLMTAQVRTTSSAASGVYPEKRRVSRLVPVALLVAAGSLTGLSTDLAKVAFDENISPYAFLTWLVVGAAAAVTATAVVRGRTPTINRSTARYFFGASVLTVVLPRLLMFSAVPKVGVSFVAVSIAFPPLFTYGFALVLGSERFDIVRAAGVALALTGSLLIAALKLADPDTSALWVALALAAPLFLALGNIYRTLRWPPGIAP
jgi:drug/metabolite transporter (DMT)-like permease